MRVGAIIIGLVLSLVGCEDYLNTRVMRALFKSAGGSCGSWTILFDDCTYIRLNDFKISLNDPIDCVCLTVAMSRRIKLLHRILAHDSVCFNCSSFRSGNFQLTILEMAYNKMKDQSCI